MHGIVSRSGQRSGADITGRYHHMSNKHLNCYSTEFEGRRKDRPADDIEQIRRLVQGMDGKRLRYQDLVG